MHTYTYAMCTNIHTLAGRKKRSKDSGIIWHQFVKVLIVAFFWEDGNVLKLDTTDGCTTFKYVKKPVGCML